MKTSNLATFVVSGLMLTLALPMGAVAAASASAPQVNPLSATPAAGINCSVVVITDLAFWFGSWDGIANTGGFNTNCWIAWFVVALVVIIVLIAIVYSLRR